MKYVFFLLASTMCGYAADLTGSWTCSVQTDAGSGSPSFVFTQTGEALKGKYSGQLGEADVTGKVTGDKVEWSFMISDGVIAYEGTIADGAIKGRLDLAGEANGTFTCQKK